jgi:uncharacterized protein (TIGR01777 family)
MLILANCISGTKLMEKNILITGGSGFLGSHLISHLEKEAYSVRILSRNRASPPYFKWNPEKNEIHEESLKSANVIIHLAGKNIASGRWTSSFKREIIASRIEGPNLIFNYLKNHEHQVRTFISASGIGIYGNNGDSWVEEDSHITDGFVADSCRQWENAASQFEKIGIRVVVLRIGIVLGKNGGVLPILALPVKYFAGFPIGSGNQYVSWIHIEDLCRIFSFAITSKSMHGIYNAVAPGPVTHKFLMQCLSKTLHRPLWPLHVPSFLLRAVLGEKSCLVLDSQRVSSEKIRLAGFTYFHTDIGKSVEELLV